MNNNNSMIYINSILLIAAILAMMVSYVFAQQNKDAVVNVRQNVSDSLSKKQKLLNKIRLLDLLLNRSLSLQQARKESGTQTASQYHEAQQARETAVNKLENGDLKSAESEINYALKILSAASSIEKKKSDDEEYVSKYKDVKERLDSFRHSLILICKEKNIKLDSVLDSGQYLLMINDAESLKEKSNYERAVLKLESASSMLEIALSKIRSNETLVHKLEFNSIEEEYAYELERHKSHILLLELMMKERSYPQSVETKILKFKKNSMNLLLLANEQYQKNNKLEARKLVEKGVDELVSAMRLGGMYTY